MRVQAVDPEGAELELRALGMENLPGTPQFLHDGNNSAIFSWQPPFGAVGIYQVTFEARETTGERPRSVQKNVTIRVDKALPDLILTRLALSSGDIRLNQTATITAAFALQQVKNFRLDHRAANICLCHQFVLVLGCCLQIGN